MESIPLECTHFNMLNIKYLLQDINLNLNKKSPNIIYNKPKQIQKQEHIIAFTDASINWTNNTASYGIYIKKNKFKEFFNQ
jgi:hypothetical protein